MVGTNRANFAVSHQNPPAYFKGELMSLLIPANDQSETKTDMRSVQPLVISHSV